MNCKTPSPRTTNSTWSLPTFKCPTWMAQCWASASSRSANSPILDWSCTSSIGTAICPGWRRSALPPIDQAGAGAGIHRRGCPADEPVRGSGKWKPSRDHLNMLIQPPAQQQFAGTYCWLRIISSTEGRGQISRALGVHGGSCEQWAESVTACQQRQFASCRWTCKCLSWTA